MGMKTTIPSIAVALTAFVGLGMLHANAARLYTEGVYSESGFTPASDNVFAGVLPIAVSNDRAGFDFASGNPAVLTDRAVAFSTNKKSRPACYTIGNDAKIQFNLPALCNITAFRIYSHWSDTNRNDIVVKSITVRDYYGHDTVLDGSSFGSSQTSEYDTIHGDPDVVQVSGENDQGRYVTFSDDAGALAEMVSSVTIEFGNQDNGYGGYLEIEAIGSRVQPPTSSVPAIVEASGAERSFYRDASGRYDVYTFTNKQEVGTLRVISEGYVDCLLVGGGGGGGMTMGGGGGAGGFVFMEGVKLYEGEFEINVGAGGAGATQEDKSGSNGGDSRIENLAIAYGGGGGASWSSNPAGLSGGSGGGGSGTAGCLSGAGGASLFGQGNPGGSANANSVAGGGGAGSPGGDGGTGNLYAEAAGDGGAGRACSITGTEVVYAGGGGGGAGLADWLKVYPYGSNSNGAGGPGGGGAGADRSSGKPGENGVDGLGGGGGGGAYGNGLATAGGRGGSGVVIVRVRCRPKGLRVTLK